MQLRFLESKMIDCQQIPAPAIHLHGRPMWNENDIYYVYMYLQCREGGYNHGRNFLEESGGTIHGFKAVRHKK